MNTKVCSCPKSLRQRRRKTFAKRKPFI